VDEAVVDLFAGELLKALGAEAFAGKGAHDAAVEHGAAVGFRVMVAGRRGSRRSRRKAVARAGGVDDFFEKHGRSAKCVLLDGAGIGFVEQRRAVFAMFDDKRFGAEAMTPRAAWSRLGLPRSCGFRVVDEQDVEALEDFEEAGDGP